MPNPRMKQRRVVHKSTAGILKPIPEAVDLVGNPPPRLTTKTVAPLHRLEIEMDYKEFRNVNNSCFSAGLSSRNCPVTFAASP